tara:strand:+ start:6075 stop:6299 length:225 start_codon:yes stop_codon:yes gene_type:complete
MWNTFKNIFQRNERQAYRVCVAGQSKYFVTFKEASIYAEEIDLAEPVEIYLGHRRLSWKLPKRMGTWKEHFNKD